MVNEQPRVLSDEVCVVVVIDPVLAAGPVATGAPEGRASWPARRAAREGTTHHHDQYAVQAAPRALAPSSLISGSPEAVTDRLAGLLPEEALQDALKGLEPEEITGPGRVADPARRPGDRDGVGRRADRAPRLSAGQAPPGGAQHPQRRRPPRRFTPSSGRSRSSTPRDRDGSFEPQLVGKRQTRLAGLDDKILGLYAGGMSVRDISAHLTSSTAPRSAATPSRGSPTPCLEDVAAWRTRPLERVYPIVYFDA